MLALVLFHLMFNLSFNFVFSDLALAQPSKENFEAALRGDFWAVSKAIASNKNVAKETDAHGMTLLMAAAESGNLNVVKLLIAAGADIHQVTANNESALWFAAQNSQTKVVQFLLKKGAKSDGVEKSTGESLIFRVAALGDLKVLSALLKDPKVDVQAVNANGETALFAAAREGNYEMAQFLIAKGLDPDQKNYAGESPAEIAMKNQYVQTTEILSKRVLTLPNDSSKSQIMNQQLNQPNSQQKKENK